MAQVVIHVQHDEQRDELLRALGAIGLSGHPGADNVVVLGGTAHPSAVSRVVIWSGGRHRPELNPFLDGAVRHAIGAAPDIDRDHLASTLRHLYSGAYLRISELLVAPEHINTHKVHASNVRPALLTGLAQFLRRHRCNDRLQASMGGALDELFTNAIYNAPVRDGVHVNTAVDRTIAVSSDRPVTVRWAADEVHLALAVRDEYGSLTAERIIGCLSRCYQFAEDQIEEKQGGAGLGLFMLLRSASRLVINIQPGRFTEFIVLRRRDESWGAFSRGTPTLNLCIGKSEQRPLLWSRTGYAMRDDREPDGDNLHPRGG